DRSIVQISPKSQRVYPNRCAATSNVDLHANPRIRKIAKQCVCDHRGKRHTYFSPTAARKTCQVYHRQMLVPDLRRRNVHEHADTSYPVWILSMRDQHIHMKYGTNFSQL